MELKVTKEKVLKAAETCSDAKKVLKEMFPEVFSSEIYIPAGKYIEIDFIRMIDTRGFAEYREKAFFLSNMFNWEIKTDYQGATCLIPTRKD